MKSYPPSKPVFEGTRYITHDIVLGGTSRPYKLKQGDKITVLRLNKVYSTTDVIIKGNEEIISFSMINRISSCEP